MFNRTFSYNYFLDIAMVSLHSRKSVLIKWEVCLSAAWASAPVCDLVVFELQFSFVFFMLAFYPTSLRGSEFCLWQVSFNRLPVFAKSLPETFFSTMTLRKSCCLNTEYWSQCLCSSCLKAHAHKHMHVFTSAVPQFVNNVFFSDNVCTWVCVVHGRECVSRGSVLVDG